MKREDKWLYNDTAVLWFGKYKDVPLKDVPVDYLHWVKTTPMYKTMSRSLRIAIGSHAPKPFNLNENNPMHREVMKILDEMHGLTNPEISPRQ